MSDHLWLRGARRRDRDAHRRTWSLPPALAVVSAHRRLRGPYTAVGTLLRAIGADALERCPGLAERHNIAILTCAPEFEGAVPPMEVPLQAMSKAGERTRFEARLHTLRIAHGIVDLVQEYLAALGGGPRTLVVEDVHEADPTDQEFLAVALRRFDPDLLRVVVGTDLEPVLDPPGPVAASLPEALEAYTGTVFAASVPAEPAGDPARAYVDGDGTDDDPRLLHAYLDLPAAERARLHDERADLLASVGEFSLELGAIPYHREHGGNPAVTGATALRRAQVHCRNLGMYHAAADLGARGRRLVDRESQPALWWELTGGTTTALSSAGRSDEAEAIYGEVRATSTDPTEHMKVAYGMAMLYARHHPEERHDYQVARAWLNTAIALASQLEDPKDRAYFTVFNGNGLALVATRQGRPDEAMRLLDEGMRRLDRDLEPGERVMHRAGLRYNRARIQTMLGDYTAALTEYAALMEVDEGFTDHYFNRAAILSRLGRPAEAIADYDAVVRLSPPFPEVHYNRADARLDLGDVEGAVADYRRVLELDPDHLDARANLAGALCDLDRLDEALAEVRAGLAAAPDHPLLQCVRGRALAERGDPAGAREALEAALAGEPDLASAWALLGVLAFEEGDTSTAIGHFDRAADLGDSPEIRFNRAVAHEHAGGFDRAISDYEAVLAAVDDEDARVRLDHCRRALATTPVR